MVIDSVKNFITKVLLIIIEKSCRFYRIRNQLVINLFNKYSIDILDELLNKYPTDFLNELLSKHIIEILKILSINHLDSLSENLKSELKNSGSLDSIAPLFGILTRIIHYEDAPEKFFQYIYKSSYALLHYGQEAEDVIVARLNQLPKKGFFVDIGAHHPVRFSNTYALYRNGWRGINIDATPGSMDEFNRIRPEDVNLELAVSENTEPRTFYIFKESALNTFDHKLAEYYISSGCELLKKEQITSIPLYKILDKYLENSLQIDLLSLDVEGTEIDVLKSNNWDKYSPNWIILEVIDISLAEIFDYPTINFLRQYGYVPKAKLVQSVILKKE